MASIFAKGHLFLKKKKKNNNNNNNNVNKCSKGIGLKNILKKWKKVINNYFDGDRKSVV